MTRIANMAFEPPPKCATCHGLGVVMGPAVWENAAGVKIIDDVPCPDCQKDTPMNIADATARKHYETITYLEEGGGIVEDHQEDAIQLLEQYRLALLDIFVLASQYAPTPKQSGSPLEQVAWIALCRGLGRRL